MNARTAGASESARVGFARERLTLTPWGIEPLETDDRMVARIDRHWEAVALALAGDDRALRWFRGLSVLGCRWPAT